MPINNASVLTAADVEKSTMATGNFIIAEPLFYDVHHKACRNEQC